MSYRLATPTELASLWEVQSIEPPKTPSGQFQTVNLVAVAPENTSPAMPLQTEAYHASFWWTGPNEHIKYLFLIGQNLFKGELRGGQFWIDPSGR